MLQFPIKLKKPHFSLKNPKTRILPKKYTQFSAFIHQKQNYLIYRFPVKLFTLKSHRSPISPIKSFELILSLYVVTKCKKQKGSMYLFFIKLHFGPKTSNFSRKIIQVHFEFSCHCNSLQKSRSSMY